MADKSLILPKKINAKMKELRSDVMLFAEWDNEIQQVIIDTLIIEVKTIKDKMFWTSGKRHKISHKHKKKKVVLFSTVHRKRDFVDPVFRKKSRAKTHTKSKDNKQGWKMKMFKNYCYSAVHISENQTRDSKERRSNKRLLTAVYCGVFSLLLALMTATNYNDSRAEADSYVELQIINSGSNERTKKEGILTASVLWDKEFWGEDETAVVNLWRERKPPSTNKFQRKKKVRSARNKFHRVIYSCAMIPTYCNSLLDSIDKDTWYAKALIGWVAGYWKCSRGRFSEFNMSDSQNKRRPWACEVLAMYDESKEKRFHKSERPKNKKECQGKLHWLNMEVSITEIGRVMGCNLRSKGRFIKKNSRITCP